MTMHMSQFFHCSGECHDAKCTYAECPHADRTVFSVILLSALIELRIVILVFSMLSFVTIGAQCYYSECPYCVEYCYSGFHYA
jgi:hypothetical protein